MSTCAIFFFFQAEDGIRDRNVTGVQTCALPISGRFSRSLPVRYFAPISATVTSSMRFENPHSLSYQLDTFTSRPDTLVSVASNVDDAGSWLKSLDTSGPLLYWRIPASGPDSAAAFMMPFTS